MSVAVHVISINKMDFNSCVDMVSSPRPIHIYNVIVHMYIVFISIVIMAYKCRVPLYWGRNLEPNSTIHMNRLKLILATHCSNSYRLASFWGLPPAQPSYCIEENFGGCKLWQNDYTDTFGDTTLMNLNFYHVI